LISKERIIEIIEYSLHNGIEPTLLAYDIPMETYNRYKREYRKHFGTTADLLMSLKQRFSDEELQAIATGSMKIPEVKNKSVVSFDGEIITFGVMSDNHAGSIYSKDEDVLLAIETMKKEKCSFIVHAGDCVEGMMNRPGSVYELSQIGYKAQRDKAVELFSAWDKPLYMTGGNHNDSFNSKFGVGMDITEDICSRLPDAKYLGSLEGNIDINGATIKVFHGNDGASYALSYREQKLLDMMTVKELPDMLITGHTHKAMFMKYRGVYSLCAGTLQKQTPFMRSKKLPAHVGWWVVTVCVQNGKMVWVQPRWYDIEG
jgi:predicted phosphodiesterase